MEAAGTVAVAKEEAKEEEAKEEVGSVAVWACVGAGARTRGRGCVWA